MSDMAEQVYRHRRRRVRMMDERRFALPKVSPAVIASASKAALQMMPGLLLSMADIMDMPSGLYAACIASLAALDKPVRWPAVGAGAAVFLRLLWGYDPRWESLITIGLLLILALVLPGRKNAALMGATAFSLLPMVVRGWMAPTALPALMTTGSLAFSVLSAPVICRGLKVASGVCEGGQQNAVKRMEDRLALGYLLVMIMCGGSRLLLAGMNTAMMLASVGVLLMALECSSGAGCAAGIISGISMALTGLPMMQAVALGSAGFLAAVMKATGLRWLSCACFGTIGVLVMLCAGTAGQGCALAMAVASAAMAMLPDQAYKHMQSAIRRMTGAEPSSGDAYAACMLAEWERTVGTLAMSVPVPDREEEKRNGAWWTAKLCDGCASLEACGGLCSNAALEGVEGVWAYHEADDEVWRGVLDGLRGLGCQRLYHLQRSMDALRNEEARKNRAVRQAMSQRSMLVTHLDAMAGAARRFAHLSLGESWWDALHAKRIRAALADAAAPVELMWLRRVDGHMQAVFALEEIIGARRQADELCALVSEAVGVPMMTVSVDGGRVRLAQRPPMEVKCGSASACADGQNVCGDTACHCLLADGRFMAVLSDGMGHGDRAALCSRQTCELLRLCLDAGYTLQQALTAVNGMMLLGDTGERFITVDLLAVDLWSGRAVMEKLGAAGTWVMQQGTLHWVEADALPLGILEDVDAGERVMCLVPGDAVVLISDGVEEAFADAIALREAVALALMEDEPACAAESLLEAAARKAGGAHYDDQTVMVLRVRAVQNV